MYGKPYIVIRVHKAGSNYYGAIVSRCQIMRTNK